MPNQEKRSLIEVGSKNRSSAITLPKPWVKYWKLRKKQKIQIFYDNILSAIPPSMSEEKKKEIRKKLDELMQNI